MMFFNKINGVDIVDEAKPSSYGRTNLHKHHSLSTCHNFLELTKNYACYSTVCCNFQVPN